MILMETMKKLCNELASKWSRAHLCNLLWWCHKLLTAFLCAVVSPLTSHHQGPLLSAFDELEKQLRVHCGDWWFAETGRWNQFTVFITYTNSECSRWCQKVGWVSWEKFSTADIAQSFKFAQTSRRRKRCSRWCLPFNKAIYHRFYWLFVTVQQQIFTNNNGRWKRKV